MIGKLIADDGAYEGNNIFRYLGDNESNPVSKLERMQGLN